MLCGFNWVRSALTGVSWYSGDRSPDVNPKAACSSCAWPFCIDSVIDEQTGLIVPVPVRDSGALMRAMARLATAPKLRRNLGRAARERVLRNFRPEDVARALVGLCCSLALQ